MGERGNSVIDYVIENNRTREGITEFRVEDKIDSDHKPVMIWIEGEKKRIGGNKGKGKVKRGDWTKKGKEEFREAFEDGMRYGEEVEEEWEILKNGEKK